MIAALAIGLAIPAQIAVSAIPGAREVAIVATFHVPGYVEDPETHGYRHLIEHLMAKGENGKQDAEWERKGIFLGAGVDRETVTFRLVGSPGQEAELVDALRSLLRWPNVTDQDVQAEAEIMEQELFLVDPRLILIGAGRDAAFGDRWRSPHGTLAGMRRATASSLRDFFQKWFTSTNLTLSAAGAVQAADLTSALEAVWESLPEGVPVPPRPARVAESARIEAPGVRGESLTVGVGSVLDSSTWAQMAAALTIAARVPDSFVSFVADPFESWVTVGRVESSSGIVLIVEAFDDADAAESFPAAKEWVKQWIRGQFADPVLAATLMGRLGSADPPITVEAMQESAAAFSFGEYQSALSRFRGDAPFRVVGAG